MSTILYLGTIGTSPELASLASFADKPERPSVLMSFHFLPQIRKTNEEQYKTVRGFDCMLDSGAYSARKKKVGIDIEALIAEIRTGGWKEAAALDSIGDPEASYKNACRMAEAGVKVGLPRDVATQLAAQTVFGSAKMVLETGYHPALLKDAVTTPAGCTIDGILELEEGGLRVTLIKAVMRATERAKQLAAG